MKKSLKISSGKKIGVLLITGMMILSACGSFGNDTEETRISINKDGSIKSYITESFDKDYYLQEELQQMILSEAASYNRSTGQGSITVEKVEAEEGTARVEMTYAAAEDYSTFNDVLFFVGSPMEAQIAGYDLNVVLSNVKDTNDTIGEADILAMEGVMLLITDVPEQVELYGKAVYADDHATLSENNKILLSAESREAAYVLFE
ncbi:MAG: hypothetical protein IJ409_06990 [Lachnospiraceae bacterium]|nr:hypothetical protein [Lachnospiraceae bacterium]